MSLPTINEWTMLFTAFFAAYTAYKTREIRYEQRWASNALKAKPLSKKEREKKINLVLLV